MAQQPKSIEQAAESLKADFAELLKTPAREAELLKAIAAKHDENVAAFQWRVAEAVRHHASEAAENEHIPQPDVQDSDFGQFNAAGGL